MKKFFLPTLIFSLFVFSVVNADVTFKMTFVDDYSDDSIPTVAAGSTFTCYFWIDPGGATIGGFSICVSYPENDIVPTNLDSPFTDAGYVSSPISLSNTRTEVTDGDDKIDLGIGTFGGSGTGQGKLATVEFQAISGLPVAGMIRWCGIGTPDPDTNAKTAVSIGGQSVPPDIHSDISLPVELSSFTALSADKGVVVSWRTEAELNNSGFDLYRSEARTGKFVKINPEMIKGAGISAKPHDYKFLDEVVEPGHTYYYYLKSIDFSGDEQQTHVIKVTIDLKGFINVDNMLGIPARSILLQNYPNPFNPETWIPFQLSKPADVTIRIYNLKGQPIRILDVGHKGAGYYLSKGVAAYWDGKDRGGELVSSGIYFYAISAGDYHAVKKLIIMK